MIHVVSFMRQDCIWKAIQIYKGARVVRERRWCIIRAFASLECATDYRLPFATPTFVLADISDYALYFPPSSNVLQIVHISLCKE